MRFRPCIDLREGRVVQIVGGSWRDGTTEKLQTNFESERSPADFALLYKKANLSGGHVISLGPGNHEAAISALKAYPGGLQMGGGINPDNAGDYLDKGASHVIVTSFVFFKGMVDLDRLRLMVSRVGKNRLVPDLSCRKKGSDFWIVTDRWQTFTSERVNQQTLRDLAEYCDEFLVHGVDVEGKRQGIQQDLVKLLGKYSPIAVTYAGGVMEFSDLDLVKELGRGRVDLTIGSALDIFGGDIPFESVVEWQGQQNSDNNQII